MKQNKTLLTLLGGWLALNLVPSVAAGASADPATSTNLGSNPDATVVLSPFTVDTTRDRGYQAANTLSGSRLNTPLRDTPSSVSVFTPEFLQDIGLDDLSQIVVYSVNADIYRSDDNSTSLQNTSLINALDTSRRIDIRGMRASQAFDYFKSITTDDSYRVGRYDENRGPNGILFGISSVGGLINQTSKTANFLRDRGSIKYSLGSNDRSRIEIDGNKILRKDRLAVSLAAVHQENGGWRTHDFQDKDRVFGALIFRPTRKITINIMGERGLERRATLLPATPGDEAFAWMDNRDARGVAAVSFAPLNANPTAAQRALGVTARNLNANGVVRRFVFIENSNTFFDSVGTYGTGSYNDATVRHPNGTPGVTGTVLGINDPEFMPYKVNVAGPGMTHRQSLHNYTATAEWEPLENLFVTFGHNFQATALTAYYVAVNGNNGLLGDPNTTMGIRGPANPFVGRTYFEGPWKQERTDAELEESRLSLSYEIKAGWMGNHRLAAMAANSREVLTRVGAWRSLVGTGFTGGVSGTNNRLYARSYIDENDPSTFRMADWRTLPNQFNVDGRVYDAAWMNDEPGGNNGSTEQKVKTALFVVQSQFFKGRVVSTLGYRKDEASLWNFGHSRDSLGQALPDFDRAKATRTESSGKTYTAGLVYHALKGISLVANASTNVGIPDFTRSVFPDARPPAPSEGEGLDLGLQVELFDRRLTAKAVYFQTNEQGAVLQNGVNRFYRDRNVRIMNAFAGVLVGPGRPMSDSQWQPIYAELAPPINSAAFDLESSGYEFSATVNATRNWRVIANYSYTDRKPSQTYLYDVVPWYGFKVDGRGLIAQGVSQAPDGRFVLDPGKFESEGTIARWVQLAGMNAQASMSTLLTSGNQSIAQEIFVSTEEANELKLMQEQGWGLRPHKVSFFTAYDFTRGRLKGFTVGGGYRWRSKNIIGANTGGGQLMTGSALAEADLMLRYKRKMPVGRFDGNLIFQVNVINLFNRDGIIPKYLSSTSDFVVPGGRGVGYSRFDLIEPRSFRFTTTYEF